jgi:hypothetical protein
MPTI